MTDSVQDAVAAAKAKLGGSTTLAQTENNPTAPKGPTPDVANVGVASAAPRLGPEINPGPHPTPPPNPGAGAPAASPTTVLPQHPGAALEPKKGGKVYHNTHPGSTFITKKGEVLAFDAKGEMSVTDPDVQKELDAIADKPGCPVYTKNYVPGQNENAPVEDIQNRAAQTVADLKAQAQRMVR